MNNKLTKKEFVRIMDILEKQQELDNAYSNTISEMFDCWAMAYDYSAITQSLLNVLNVMFDDIEAKWIEYWIYELDFGKKWKKGTVTYNGKSIKLKTAEDLYNYLNKK